MNLNLSISVSRPSLAQSMLLVTACLGLGVLAGWLQVELPFIGPGVLLAVVWLPLLLNLAMEWKLSLLLATLFFSRVLLLLGFPGLVNYLYVVILVAIVIDICYGNFPQSRAGRRVFIGISLFLLVSIVSALFGTWWGLRPLIFLFLYTAPFIVFIGLSNLSRRQLLLVRNAALAVGLTQIPVSFFQYFALGLRNDHVRGTFVEQGAGAHVLGMAGVLTAVLIAMDPPRKMVSMKYPILLALLSLGFMADAKQIYPVLLIGVTPFLLFLIRRRVYLLPVFVGTVAALTVLATRINQSFANITNFDHLLWLFGAKRDFTALAFSGLDLVTTLLGRGPGAGASRVSLLSLPNFGNVPTALVGDGVSDLVRALMAAMDRFFGDNPDTSVASPFTSWLGLFTDVGLIGVAIYFVTGVMLMKSLISRDGFRNAIVRSLMLTTFLLGAMYAWLEEPAFTVLLVVVLVSVGTPGLSLRSELSGGEQFLSLKQLNRANRYHHKGV